MKVNGARLVLQFGQIAVGEIVGAFWSDNTGYGTFHQTMDGDDAKLTRVREYIAFSKEWHTRLKADLPHDASECDRYRDIYDSDQWNTVGSDGSVIPIGGPVVVEGEVTWRPVT